MVGVVVVKSAEYDFFRVGPVVPIAVRKKLEVGALGYVNAFRRQLKADREVEIVCPDLDRIGTSVAVRVFKYEQFVVGPGVPGFIMRIGRHSGNPEPAGIVKGHLYRVGQFGEFRLRGKH